MAPCDFFLFDRVKKPLLKELKSAKYFSIIVDSSPDISHTDQLAKNAARLSNEYKEDLPDSESFQNECLHFFGFLKNLDEPPSTIREMCNMIYDKGLQEVYPYINIVLRIFLCIPVTNSSAERSFSVLRRVKNYLRSTMCNERFNCSAVLTIESEIAKRII
ncbi:hypothetical protein ALC60_07108 [Trachymyrmex zeteki]|uniref:HAT C-terminal dimerisation domain-containing protein n=1 Tax=Mycetomoellerius zeteki TaxID=64791 RepID=A0A151X0Q5_9HYME|nr:hypothetical protein ALC60_07108 [Trachymyrmex zeteki]